MELHTIELKKFCENAQVDFVEITKRVKTSLDMWVAFLTRHDLMNKDHLPPQLDDPALKKALDVLEVMNMRPDEMEAYEERFKWLMIQASTLRKRYEDGKIEGREEGREEAREEVTKNMARRMLQEGIDIQVISKITGMPVAEIQGLVASLADWAAAKVLRNR